MDKCPFCVALLSLSLLSADAQEPSAPRTAAIRDPKIFEGYGRQLAQTFESLRRENNLPKLSRITRRQELDQLVCTAALNDANPSGKNFPAKLMYKTSLDRFATRDGTENSDVPDVMAFCDPPSRFSRNEPRRFKDLVHSLAWYSV